MTTTQDLIAQLRALGIPDWAMARVLMTQAADTLEALQAEHTDEVMRGLMLEKAHAMGLAERDAALARLAELEISAAELERLCDATYVAQGADAYNHACECMEAFQEKRRATGKEVGTTRSLCDGMGWVYRRLDELEAAGAPLVATPIVAWAKSTPRKLRITTMDMGGEDGWRPLGYTAAGASPVEPSQALSQALFAAAGASPQQSPLLQFCTCEDCKPMECEGCRINRERRELLPAPGEAAREYMTGYSDGREWAGATNQAQPSQELGLTDEELNVLWNFAVETGNPTAGNAHLRFARAVIAAINAKEQPNG